MGWEIEDDTNWGRGAPSGVPVRCTPAAKPLPLPSTSRAPASFAGFGGPSTVKAKTATSRGQPLLGLGHRAGGWMSTGGKGAGWGRGVPGGTGVRQWGVALS